ncbi:hypothetical protein LSTR_LSTR006571 [Laodelphax striatellus]|uniref:Odorant receptor n=1 Tax=Laodelphax striatellus TaxID=195883 RepID=A0A482WUG0_LAOST|nr:hypothetical protein LSTR_LSTR006571 [Laodelphax striatellus]
MLIERDIGLYLRKKFGLSLEKKLETRLCIENKLEFVKLDSMMKKTITTAQLKNVVKALGYLPDGRKTIGTYFFTIFFLLYAMNLICGLCHEWDNFKIRLEIIRDFILIINLEVYWLSVPDVYIFKFHADINVLETHSEHFLKLFLIMNFVYSYLPFLNAVYLRATSENFTNFKTVPQISYFYYPMTEVTFAHYCFGTLFLYTGLICASVFSFCILYSSYLALHCVMSAFSQLRTFILKWDEIGAEGVGVAELNMEDCLLEIVVFHQEICSEARLLNKGMETATMNLLQGCVVQICLSLFNILEGGDKIKFGGFTCFILLMLVGFSSFGQILEDRIARIKMTLWESRWVEKPLSVRKTLFMMMIGASTQIELRPFGLRAGLNMQSFAKV